MRGFSILAAEADCDLRSPRRQQHREVARVYLARQALEALVNAEPCVRQQRLYPASS